MHNIRFIFLFIAFMTNCVYAAESSQTCPAGYNSMTAKYIELYDGSCPAGTIDVGTAKSCLVASPSGDCYMYAPTGITYSDEIGEYKYNGICPLS